MAFHPDKSAEYAFQNHIVESLVGHGGLLGSPSKYNRELALYPEDTLAFVKQSQPDQWEKYCGIYPNNPEEKFLEKVASQLNNADLNAGHATSTPPIALSQHSIAAFQRFKRHRHL